jgi:hypothetical protein
MADRGLSRQLDRRGGKMSPSHRRASKNAGELQSYANERAGEVLEDCQLRRVGRQLILVNEAERGSCANDLRVTMKCQPFRWGVTMKCQPFRWASDNLAVSMLTPGEAGMADGELP